MSNIEKLLEKAKHSKNRSLTENNSKQMLKTFGIPVISETVALSEDQAVKAAQEIGFPVVLKGLGSTLMHKTERGLVHLNLTDPQSVHQAALSVSAEAGDELEGFLIQPQIQGRREFVAGLFRDEQFGVVVMLGIGGVFTEAISDVVFKIAPLTDTDAADMLDEIRAKALLGDFRGEKAADRGLLIQTLTGLSRIGMTYPDIAEIDINPLLITPDGDVCAVDALVVLAEERTLSEKPHFPRIDPLLLGKFFHPKSIAFVGATAQMGKWGHMLPTLTISMEYEGNIWLVNPKGGTIAGRQVYPSVGEIPDKVDLAVVTIPAAGVMDLIPQFKEKGIRNMLLITSGFAEIGKTGRELEESLIKKAREAGILVSGPNTMGLCNPHIRLYCTGSPVCPRPGSTSMVAQSGNMGTQLLAFAEQQGIGVRCFSGSGNEAMITIEDYLEGFELDDVTRIIMLYIESVKNGRRFFESARRISKSKPIILLKGGRTQVGKKAAASHTGALASNSDVFDAVCKQAGIINVGNPMNLLDLSAAFSSLPLPAGNRVAIMTLGGGWGVVAADLCSDNGLEVPELSPEIIEQLDQILPPYWSRSNPVDIVGERDSSMPMVITEILSKWEGCDAVIVLGIIGQKNLFGRFGDSILKADPSYSPEFVASARQELIQFEEKYIEHIIRLMEKYNKPVFGVSLLNAGRDQTLYRKEGSDLKGVFYPTPERAVEAFARMCEYQRFLARQ